MNKIYISDSNIWIDIHNAGLLDELFQLPVTLCSTDFVLDELNDLPEDQLVARGLRVETLDGDEVGKLYALKAEHNNSSLADVSCYYLAQQTGYPLLTGDGRLRKQAAKDGIQVLGVIWLLEQLIAHGVIAPARAAQALETMLQHGARLPQTECQQRIQQWR